MEIRQGCQRRYSFSFLSGTENLCQSFFFPVLSSGPSQRVPLGLDRAHMTHCVSPILKSDGTFNWQPSRAGVNESSIRYARIEGIGVRAWAILSKRKKITPGLECETKKYVPRGVASIDVSLGKKQNLHYSLRRWRKKVNRSLLLSHQSLVDHA